MHKSNTIKSLCFAAAFVFAGFAANAQLTHLEQSVFLNFNASVAEFNNDIDPVLVYNEEQIPLTRYNVGKSAGAGVGLGYRITYRFDVGFGEVSPYIHADFMWNRTKSKIRDKFTEAGDGKAPQYFNLPIFVGVNYRYKLNDIFTPFGEFGIGPDFFFITKESGVGYVPKTTTTINPADGSTITTVTKEPTSFEYKYKSTTNVAWQIGAGCFFGEHVSASLHYNGYGKHAIKTDDNQDAFLVTTKQNNTKVQSRSIGLLSLRIGFHF